MAEPSRAFQRADRGERLVAWLARTIPGAEDVRVEGLDAIVFGHSAETLSLVVNWRADGAEHREDAVLRLRPPPPGLLEPYDIERQFRILRALEPTEVRAPRALWLEHTGEVLGREFYAMERREGLVVERVAPDELKGDPARVRRMCQSMLEQIAAIHRVDVGATGLDELGHGRDYLERELEHWGAEIERVKRGRLPQLERLRDALRERRPAPCPAVTLVHGDPKPGNFAFAGAEVSAVFDWELAAVGDPLADIGWVEFNWDRASPLTRLPGALSRDEAVAYWSELTGIAAENREWYRALQGFKMLAIMLLGAMLFDSGASDDLRLAAMGQHIPAFTAAALAELGIEEELEPGPVTARAERVAAAKAARP